MVGIKNNKNKIDKIIFVSCLKLFIFLGSDEDFVCGERKLFWGGGG